MLLLYHEVICHIGTAIILCLESQVLGIHTCEEVRYDGLKFHAYYPDSSIFQKRKLCIFPFLNSYIYIFSKILATFFFFFPTHIYNRGQNILAQL